MPSLRELAPSVGKLGSDAGRVSPWPCDRSRGASGADPAPGHREQLLLLPPLVPCSLPTYPPDSILGDAGPAFPLALSLPAPTRAAAAGLTAPASAPFLQPHDGELLMAGGGCLRGSGDWTPGREPAVGTRVMECASHNEPTGPDPVRSCQSTSRGSVLELLWERRSPGAGSAWPPPHHPGPRTRTPGRSPTSSWP